MAPKIDSSSAFDTFHAIVTDSIGDYPEFDVALGQLKNIDWDSIDMSTGKELAKNVGMQIVDKGLDFAKDYVGEIAGSVAVAAGIGSGSIFVGAVMAAVGVAIEWGLDAFELGAWRKGDEEYTAGTWVVIQDGLGTHEHEGLRRRLTKDQVSVGIAMGPSHGGYVDVQNLQTGIKQALPVQSVSRLPDGQATQLESNPALHEFASIVRQKSKTIPDELDSHFSTRVGSSVSYKNEGNWTVEHSTQDGVILESDGRREYTTWDDGDVSPGWNISTHNPYPAARSDSFNTGGGGFNTADFVWVNGNKVRLAVVYQCKPDKVDLCYAWDGTWEQVGIQNCDKADNGAYRGSIFARFREAVSRGNKKLATSISPGRLGKSADCIKQEFGAVGPDIPLSLRGKIIGHGFKSPLPGYETTQFAKEKIDFEEQYTNKYGGVPDYENTWETREWNVEYADADPEEKSSSMVFVALGVGLVLAVALSR